MTHYALEDMATYQTDPRTLTGNDDDEEDDQKVLSKFVYGEKSIDELAKERDENWSDTYHTLLEELDKASNGK